MFEECTISLGQTGGAVESTDIMHIPGVFMSKEGAVGMKAVLQDRSFSKEHNFNLLSMSRLLYTQGWLITHGDKSLVCIGDRNGGVINFDIVVPTAKGAVYVCKFEQGIEIASGCTTTGTCMNINMAHCLLGHRNKDSIRKTAKQIGWELTRGSLKPCEHCAKSKATQKNVQKESAARKAIVPGHRLYLNLSKVTVRLTLLRMQQLTKTTGRYLSAKPQARSGAILLRQKVTWLRGHVNVYTSSNPGIFQCIT